MAREWLVSVVLATIPGCSFILDFSDSAAPHDAPFDAPYTPDQCAYDEPNDTPDQAVAIAPGVDTGPAAICPSASGVDDADYYKFSVPAGTSTVKVSITFTNSLGDLDLKLFDPTQTTVAQSRGFGDGESITCPNAPGSSPLCPALASGVYTFEVFPATPGTTNAYSFAVSLQ
jgi:hypothetical protein